MLHESMSRSVEQRREPHAELMAQMCSLTVSLLLCWFSSYGSQDPPRAKTFSRR